MFHIQKTDEFLKWIDGLKDMSGRSRILSRIERFRQGNCGDVKSVGDNISEMRFDFGPGYRAYYFIQIKDHIILLNGGDKKSQKRDIKKAKELTKLIMENNQ